MFYRLYQYLLHNPEVLPSQEYPQNHSGTNVTLTNELAVPVTVFVPYYIDQENLPLPAPVLYKIVTLMKNDSFATTSLPPKAKAYARSWLVKAKMTGGIIALLDAPFSDVMADVRLTPDQLCVPGDFGPIPVPSAGAPGMVLNPPPAFVYPPTTTLHDGTVRTVSTLILPTDSPRIFVGCGTSTNAENAVAMVCREQFWARHPTSYCLAAGEKRTVNITTTQGKQSSSSEVTSATASVGADVSAGWGAFSASVSASMSMESTTTQQVTISEENSVFITTELDNSASDKPAIYLCWQMNDVVTVCDAATHKPLSSVISAGSPIIVMGPYTLAE